MQILISQSGDKILVDDKDWLLLSNFKWQTTSGYALTWMFGKFQYMHVYLCPHAKGQVTDHRNRNPLDNQRHNLRATSRSTDLFNRKTFKNNKLKVKGVRKRGNTFTAQISINQKPFHLGSFKKLEDAKRAYLEAREKHDIQVLTQV